MVGLDERNVPHDSARTPPPHLEVFFFKSMLMGNYFDGHTPHGRLLPRLFVFIICNFALTKIVIVNLL